MSNPNIFELSGEVIEINDKKIVIKQGEETFVLMVDEEKLSSETEESINKLKIGEYLEVNGFIMQNNGAIELFIKNIINK